VFGVRLERKRATHGVLSNRLDKPDIRWRIQQLWQPFRIFGIGFREFDVGLREQFREIVRCFRATTRDRKQRIDENQQKSTNQTTVTKKKKKKKKKQEACKKTFFA
jgi:hypothetical protein